MTEIALTKGYTAVVDDIDADLKQYKWFSKVGHTGRVYASRFEVVNGKRELLSIHRIVLGRSLGRSLESGEFPDHADNDPLNNRRSNLRLASRSQNQYNARSRTDNTSGFKGVSLHKLTGRWQAYISVEGHLKYLGLFDTPEAAYAERMVAALFYHGDFAK